MIAIQFCTPAAHSTNAPNTLKPNPSAGPISHANTHGFVAFGTS